MIEKTLIKVHGYHLDLYGHVNNTRYLEFLEEARWNIKEKYFDYPQTHDQGFGFVVVNTNINYRSYARLGDTLEIRSRIIRIGTKSATFRHEIYLSESATLVVDAEVTFAFVDLQSGKAMAISPEWRQRLEALQI